MTSTPADHASFEPWRHPSPLVDAIESLRGHRDDPLRSRFEVTGAKLNGRGLLHAGAITTIADITIGHGIAAVADEGHRYVTVQLSCEFLGTASLGDVVDVTVTPVKVRGRLAAGTATFDRDGRTIATASALFLPA